MKTKKFNMPKRPVFWLFLMFAASYAMCFFLGAGHFSSTRLYDYLEENEKLNVQAQGIVSGISQTEYGWSVTLKDTSLTALPHNNGYDSTNETAESATSAAAGTRFAGTAYDSAAGNGKDETLRHEDAGRVILYMENANDIKIGNRVSASGTLALFETASNPGQFDARAYYETKKIYYRLDAQSVTVTDASTDIIGSLIFGLKEKIKSNIRQCADDGTAAIFYAIFLGDTSHISQDTNALYAAGGISHILSISGLHISLMGMGVFRLLGRISARRALPYIIAISLVIFYVVLAGASASAIRAAIMFGAMLASRIFGKSYDTLSAMGLAGVCLLSYSSALAFTAGFELSFISVLAISAIMPELSYWAPARGGRGRGVLLSFAAGFGNLPIVAWHFNIVPMYGWAANIIAIPFLSLLLISAILTGLVPFISHAAGVFAAGAGHMIIKIYELVCKGMELLPFCSITTGRPHMFQMLFVAAAIIGLTLFLRRNNLKRKFGIMAQQAGGNSPARRFFAAKIMALAAIYFILAILLCRPAPGCFSITSVDVGQGDCTIIRTPAGAALMIDAGSGSVENVWEKRIYPYLKYERINNISAVALTHPDEDHINAICDMLQEDNISIGTIIIPEATYAYGQWDEIKSAAATKGTIIRAIAAGEYFELDGATVTCLYPQHTQPGGTEVSESLNAASMALSVEYDGFVSLFTGDLGILQEEGIKDILPDADFIKAGHHGGKNSTGAGLLERTTPKAAFISCGKNNIYGHPHKDTLQRLKDAGCKYYITAQGGALSLYLHGKGDGRYMEITTHK